MRDFSYHRQEIERVYGKISPFELKDKLISLAEDSRNGSVQSLLDAGRGNPNWIAAERGIFYIWSVCSFGKPKNMESGRFSRYAEKRRHF